MPKIWIHDELLHENPANGYNLYKCVRSGAQYRLDLRTVGTADPWPDSEVKQFAELLRRHFLTTGETPFVDPNLLKQMAALHPPSYIERYQRGLKYLFDLHSPIGTKIRVQKKSDAIFQGFLGATYTTEIAEAWDYLEKYQHEGHIRDLRPNASPNFFEFRLTVAGAIEAERIISKNLRQHQCFVAMWFNDSMDSVWSNSFEPSIRKCGYLPRRIDKKEHNNKIDDEIIAEIKDSRFVIADFTSERDKPRGGVYFEAGFALAFGLPVIWTCKLDLIDQVHFDTRQFNHIVWDSEEDLSKKLVDRIRATIGQGPLTPS